ncbi:death-associated inhibitor of apoptosis 1-like [Argopecten irradians]|uniref:death-associated inhibitor of apoptosis 1-like n=1 Tax=Argopecten irradians TaxID=31199 RepID=UPI003723A3CA
MPGPPKRPPTSKQQSNTNPDNSNTSGATNVDTGQPCRPEYADLIARILSLYNYPPDKRQSRNELAQAGFFYEGPGDRVVCYFCGGGVHSWNATDDPLQEHIKLYRYCQYAQQEYRRRCQNPRPLCTNEAKTKSNSTPNHHIIRTPLRA